MKEKIWLSSPHMSGNEMKYIDEALDNNLVFPMGPNVAGLEEDLKKYSGTEFCACLSSGTSAIHLALINLGIDIDDEVICSSFTFSASANPIVYQRAIPIFIDSELSTWNMDSELLKEAILDRIKLTGKKPKAILVVHLYGMPANMEKIMTIASEFNVPVIEDAAEALGSTFKGKHCGTFGEMGIYSFNGNKVITTSGGGALLSQNSEHCKNATFLATQARDPAPHYQHSHIGFNYRMSNICAGVGRGQMEVLTDRIKKRRENFFYYMEQLKDFEGISFLTEPSDDYYSNHWLSTFIIDPLKSNGVDRENIRAKFELLNIESRPLWKPMHMQPIFSKYPIYKNGVSEYLFNNGLCLPSSSNITDKEREFVVESIKGIINL